MSEFAGSRLGPYALLGVVRRRQLSTTYRARAGNRTVAVTVLPRVADAAYLAELKREAEARGRLRHAHIVPVEDVGEQDGHVYLVEEYVETPRTLADAGQLLDPAEALGLAAPLLAALQHAHQHGVVHRDVTPRHILLPSPLWPLLTDFAIGRGALVAGEPGVAAVVVGNPAYLAPEQAFGQPAGPPADIYAMGVVLHELLTGRVPFEGPTPEAVLRRQAYESPPPLRRLRPELPEALETVLLRTLAKNPDDRPAGAAQLADDLWQAVRGRVTAVPAPRTEPGRAGEPEGVTSDPLAETYAAGVTAFAAEKWDEAVALLGRVADVDPTYEDVLDLLRAATAALGDDGG